MPTYEGRRARIVGVLWNSAFIMIYSIISTTLIVRIEIFPRSFQNVITGITPWLQTNPTRVVNSTMVIAVLFAVLGLIYALSGLMNALVVSDYSITIKVPLESYLTNSD